MKSLLILSMTALILSSACTPAAGALSQLKQVLNPSVDPLEMNRSYVRRLSDLPLTGQVADNALPWSDSNWPSKYAGIANRWTLSGEEIENANNFSYELKSYEQLSRLDMADLQKLSPAEKFDIYAGRYDYPTVKAEWQRNQPNVDDHESLQHGWASASLNFAEPSAVQVSNEDGVEIEFTSSDIKALLSYYQGQVSYARTNLLGERCRVEFDRFSGKNCKEKESNAGAFHLVLANELGRKNQGYVMDLKIDGQSLNFPVHSYATVIEKDNLLPLPHATPGTVREIEVKTTVVFSNVTEASLDATNETALHSDLTVVYQYRLELDQAGMVLGGTWISQERPEFMWRQERPVFEKDFVKLQGLYELSIAH
jgi:hypothetical protein